MTVPRWRLELPDESYTACRSSYHTDTDRIRNHGDRSVRCNLPTGHDGDHDELVDGEPGVVSWPRRQVDEIERLRAEVATLTAERDRLRARVHEVVDEANRRFAPFVSRCQSFDVRSAWARNLIGDDWTRTSEAVRLAVLSIIEERDLAVVHDRQPYPTAWAYRQAAAALEKHRERADKAEAELDRQRPVIEAARAWQADWGPTWMEALNAGGNRDLSGSKLHALLTATAALDGAAPPSTSEPHHYVSTACHPHGLHRYCAAGIRADGSTKQAACCMHCGTPCRCGCHTATTGEEVSDE